MKAHTALSLLIGLEERVGQLYLRFFQQFSGVPRVADLWWEMALEEHGHAGILKMIKTLAVPAGKVQDLRPRLRPLQALIRRSEREAGRIGGIRDALAIAVRLEQSELDQLGRETMWAMAPDLPAVPRSVFAPHEAHLDRLTRTVRRLGGEAVLRKAWALSADARDRRATWTRGRTPGAESGPAATARRRTRTASRPPSGNGPVRKKRSRAPGGARREPSGAQGRKK